LKITLNIGLGPPQYLLKGTEHQFSNARRRLSASMTRVIESFGPCYFELDRGVLGGEQTLIMVCYSNHEFDPSSLTEKLHNLAEALNQDCIAYILNHKGKTVSGLAGPHASNWLPFDDKFFVHPKRAVNLKGTS
jgi:hypothetical protein